MGRAVNAPIFERRIGIPVLFSLSIVPARRVYEMPVHHVQFDGLFRAGEGASLVRAAGIARFVPRAMVDGWLIGR